MKLCRGISDKNTLIFQHIGLYLKLPFMCNSLDKIFTYCSNVDKSAN